MILAAPPLASAETFAGFTLGRPLIMGICNVTPDSFSDGGETLAPDTAIAHGLRLVDEGADIVDVGGESTRPGAVPVPVAEEMRRVLPVIRGLAAQGVCVSVDTRHAAVMEAALAAGARIINDVTALTGDARALAVAAQSTASVVLMHMRGEPQTMQQDPRYDDVVAEVRAFLAERVARCLDAGIPLARLAVDPGIGFGKTPEHNLMLLRELSRLRSLGCAVVVGASRKSFIAHVSRGEPPRQRLGGSLAAALAAVVNGAHILRVHDVAATVQALNTWRAIERAPPSASAPHC